MFANFKSITEIIKNFKSYMVLWGRCLNIRSNVSKASNRNDDPARIRWINSDLIGFTNKMKNIKALCNIKALSMIFTYFR